MPSSFGQTKKEIMKFRAHLKGAELAEIEVKKEIFKCENVKFKKLHTDHQPDIMKSREVLNASCTNCK